MTQGFRTSYLDEPVKLSKLRAKTDKQLQGLIHSKLELGLNFLALIEDMNSNGSPDHAEQLLRRAKQAVMEVKQLLPILKDDQRQGFGSKLNELEKQLECLRNGERPSSAITSPIS